RWRPGPVRPASRLAWPVRLLCLAGTPTPCTSHLLCHPACPLRATEPAIALSQTRNTFLPGRLRQSSRIGAGIPCGPFVPVLRLLCQAARGFPANRPPRQHRPAGRSAAASASTLHRRGPDDLRPTALPDRTGGAGGDARDRRRVRCTPTWSVWLSLAAM